MSRYKGKAYRRRRNRARERSHHAIIFPRINAGKLTKARQQLFRKKLK